jgi:hypothetical protein
MKKAATVFLVLTIITALPAVANPEEISAHRGTTAFALTGYLETPGFSLAGSGNPVVSVEPMALDLHEIRQLVMAEKSPEVAAPGLKRDPSTAPLSLSVFMGRGNGDIFSALHEEYTWKAMFKSRTLGLGIYRDIPISKGIRLQPYVGIIRARATLRPSDLYGNFESFEYRLTMFCVGVPIVCRFN